MNIGFRVEKEVTYANYGDEWTVYKTCCYESGS